MGTNIKKKKIFDMKKLPFLSIAVICFGCSGFISIITMKTQGSTLIAMAVFITLAFASELVKFSFPSAAILMKNLPIGVRITLMFIGIIAITYSIIFTFAYSKNEAATLSNDFIANSSEVKNAEKASTTRDSLITRLEKEIKGLEDEKVAQLSVLDTKRFRTKRENITKDFNKQIKWRLYLCKL